MNKPTIELTDDQINEAHWKWLWEMIGTTLAFAVIGSVQFALALFGCWLFTFAPIYLLDYLFPHKKAVSESVRSIEEDTPVPREAE